MNAVLKQCALVVCGASFVFFASSSADAQTSFGRMRDAQRQAPEKPALGDEVDAFNVDEKSEPKGKPASGKPAPDKNTVDKKAAEKKASEKKASEKASPAKPASPRASATPRPTNPARDAANSKTSKPVPKKPAKEARPSPKPSAKPNSSKPAPAENPSAQPKGKHGPILGSPTSHKYRAGMLFGAQPGGTCTDVFGTAPVPTEFPEQKVRTLEEDFPRVAKVAYRDLKEGGARQLVFKMRELREGQSVEATALFEVTRYTISAPKDTEIYQIPKTVPNDVKRYLKESKYMESNSKTIKSLAKETTKDVDGAWGKVDAILAFVRDNIQYKEVLIEKPMRGALAALRSRDGDCEDMSALFISMCRAIDVPARLVRVPGHCWAEFYLVDDEKVGYWFPAQVAGTDALGDLKDARVILQKGDSFKLPESPREEELYVKELFTGKVKEGGPDPIHQFIQEVDGK